MKKGYHSNIEKKTLENTYFRQVEYTSHFMQVVLMTLNPKEDIGQEVHEDTDQFFRVEKGEGVCIINETEYTLSDGDAIVVPAGSSHNVINTSETEALHLYTIYAPAHHQDKIVHKTKAEAERDSESFNGVTTEN